jgi:hypothetical protein
MLYGWYLQNNGCLLGVLGGGGGGAGAGAGAGGMGGMLLDGPYSSGQSRSPVYPVLSCPVLSPFALLQPYLLYLLYFAALLLLD